MGNIDIPPNQTLYVNNLEDKINVDELKVLLYEFFSPFGIVLDIVIKKDKRCRGQAFVIFDTIASATLAFKHLKGKLFLNKHININYAKTKSKILEKIEGTYMSSEDYKETLKKVENVNTPTYTLFVQNLPGEINHTILEILFKQYPGYKETRHMSGATVAFIDFHSMEDGKTAMDGLQGFKVTIENEIKITWAR